MDPRPQRPCHEARLRVGLGGLAAHFGPCVGAPDPLTLPLAREDLSQLGHRGWEVLREKKCRGTWIQWCILGNKVKVRDTELQTKAGQDTPSFRPYTRDQVPEPSPAGRHLRDAQVRVNAQNEK